MVGWIKMKLGMQIDLGLGHIVLDGDPAPSRAGSSMRLKPFSLRARARIGTTKIL